MPTLAQPRLNRSFVLRYDRAHGTVEVEKNDPDAEFDAQIDAILASKGYLNPSQSGTGCLKPSSPNVEVSNDSANSLLIPGEFDAKAMNCDGLTQFVPDGALDQKLGNRGLGNDHMDVNGISGVGRAQPLGGVRPTQDIETTATNALSPQDEVQISSAAQAMDELSRTADVRMERISQIQQEIAEGIYDSDEKLDAALDRFLDAYGLNDD